MTTLRKDPSAGTTPADGSIIKTDQHNEIVDRLGGVDRLAASKYVQTDSSGFLTTVDGLALADGKIFVGNVSGLATGVTPTGDVTIDNTGATAIGSGKVTNAMLAGSIAYSKLALSGAILNADLAGSIAYSKLSLAGSILNADINTSAAIAYSKLALANSIVNADISASAAIAKSKISSSGTFASTDLPADVAYYDVANDWSIAQTVDKVSTPTTPAADKIKTFGRGNGATTGLAFVDELGRQFSTGPDMWRTRRPMFLSVNAGQLQGCGFQQPALAASAAFLTATVDANGPIRVHRSAASANAQAGWDSFGAPNTRRDLNFDFTFKFAVVTATNIRGRVGLAASTTMTAAANAGVEHIDVRIDTGAGNTNFCVTNSDGINEDITQVNAADTNLHTIRFVADNANTRIGYSWDGAAITWLSTHIPAATTALCAYCEVRTLNSAATDWDFRWLDGSADK